MFRSITTLALIVLTSAFAAAQVPGNGQKLDPKAVASGVKAPTKQLPELKTPALPGDLKIDVTKFAKRNVAVGDAGLAVDEKAKSVTVTVKNLGTIQENSVSVQLGVADAIDGSLIFVEQVKGSGPIPAGGSKTVTFTGLDFAAFKQQVVQQLGATNGNKLIVVAIADHKGVISETNEDDNAGIKFIK